MSILNTVIFQKVSIDPSHLKIISFHTNIPKTFHHRYLIPNFHVYDIKTSFPHKAAHYFPSHQTFATFLFTRLDKSSTYGINLMNYSFGNKETIHPILSYCSGHTFNKLNTTCNTKHFCSPMSYLSNYSLNLRQVLHNAKFLARQGYLQISHRETANTESGQSFNSSHCIFIHATVMYFCNFEDLPAGLWSLKKLERCKKKLNIMIVTPTKQQYIICRIQCIQLLAYTL